MKFCNPCNETVMTENESALNETVIKVDIDEKEVIKLDAAKYKKKVWIFVFGSVLFVVMIKLFKWEVDYKSSKKYRSIFRIMNAKDELFEIHSKTASSGSFSTNMAVWVVKNDLDLPKYSLVTVLDANRQNIDKIYHFISEERSTFKDSKLFTNYCEITGCQNYETFRKKNIFNVAAIFAEVGINQFESLAHFMEKRKSVSHGSRIDEFLASEIKQYIVESKFNFLNQKQGYLLVISPADGKEIFGIPVLDSFIKSLEQHK